ncbi:MAG: thiamine diphosphokinase [Candidatus Limnocylindrales bacterium]
MHALILADGDAPTRAELDRVWPAWDEGVGLVVAADGGARHAKGLGVRIDRWVGDGDSIADVALQALVQEGVLVVRAQPDKDESDTELAVLSALAAGARRITIVGALGGLRLDHGLANVALLALPELAGIAVRIVTGTTRIRLLTGSLPGGAPVPCDLPGRIGDLVSLLPLGGDVLGVTTAGLLYPLVDDTLRLARTRGLSNIRVAATARVIVQSGRLLIIEAPATL